MKTTTEAPNPSPKALLQDISPHVSNVLLAMVMAKAERERVDVIQRRILAEDEYTGRMHERSEQGDVQYRITEPKDTYHMDDQSSEQYFARCDAEYKRAGYDLEPGFCPALIADSLKRDAEHALIDAAETHFPGLAVNKLLCGTADKNGLEALQSYLDLLIGMVVNSPGFRNPLTGKVVKS